MGISSTRAHARWHAKDASVRLCFLSSMLLPETHSRTEFDGRLLDLMTSSIAEGACGRPPT